MQQFIAAPDGSHSSFDYASQGGSYTPGSGTGASVNIGASSGPVGGYGPDQVQTQQVGLINAFSMVNNLENINSGLANTATNTWANPHSARINAIANTLAACVNTDGGPVSGGTSTICSSLMADATVNSLVPQDTLQAAWMIAQNPTHNVSTLLALATGTGSPFQTPAPITSATDLSLEVGFAPTFGASSSVPGDNAVYEPQSLAIDENGHVWLYNYGGTTGITGAYVSELGANGAALAGPFQSFTVNGGFSGTGSPACPTTVSETLVASAAAPNQMAIDQSGYLWVSNVGESSEVCGGSTAVHAIMRIDANAPPASSSSAVPSSTPGYWVQNAPGALVVDAANNVWDNAASGPVQSFTNAASTYEASTTSLGAFPYGATTDGLGNVWLYSSEACTSTAYGLLSKIVSSSISGTGSGIDAIVSSTHTTGVTCTGGNQNQTTTAVLAEAFQIAADANNGIWAANENGVNTITYFAPTSSAWTTSVAGSSVIPTTGALSYSTTGMISNPSAVAVDGANHAWVGSYNSTGSGDTLGEFSVTLAAVSGNITSINPLNGTVGYEFAAVTTPFPHQIKSIGIDPSGNIWLGSLYAQNYITVVVGAASPVITPLTFQAEYNRIGQTPQ